MDARVKSVISGAAALGIEVDELTAEKFVVASALVKSEPLGTPKHSAAKQIVVNFARHMATGQKSETFSEFELPDLREMNSK